MSVNVTVGIDINATRAELWDVLADVTTHGDQSGFCAVRGCPWSERISP